MNRWVTRVWRCLSPLVVYVVVNFIVSFGVTFVLLSEALGKYGMEMYSNAALYNQVMSEVSEKLNANLLLVTAIGSGVLTPFLLLMHFKDRKKIRIVPADMPIFTWVNIVILGCGLCIALNGLVTVTNLGEYFKSGYEDTAEAIYSASIGLQILAVAVLAPITEELIFRGLMYKRMRTFLTAPLAVVLSATMFGVFHGNLLQFIYASLLGVVLAYVYERFRTVLAPIMVHAAANGVSLILSNDRGIGELIAGTEERFMIATVISLVIVAICIYLLVRTKGEREEQSSEKAIDGHSAML